MGFFSFLIFALVWTAICVAVVAGLERVLESMGYKATPVPIIDADQMPPAPED